MHYFILNVFLYLCTALPCSIHTLIKGKMSKCQQKNLLSSQCSVYAKCGLSFNKMNVLLFLFTAIDAPVTTNPTATLGGKTPLIVP